MCTVLVWQCVKFDLERVGLAAWYEMSWCVLDRQCVNFDLVRVRCGDDMLLLGVYVWQQVCPGA